MSIRLPGRDRAPLDLPPVFTLVRVAEDVRAHDHAIAIAAEAGAATLVWTDRNDVAEFAVILEPAEPLTRARASFFIGMAALLDTLAMRAPPEKPLTVDWPGAVLMDGGLLGGGRLAWPDDAVEDEPPAWVVFSAMVRVALLDVAEPGLAPAATGMVEEGFDEVDVGDLLAAFARHLMVHVDSWQERGLKGVASEYLGYLATGRERDRRGIDVSGDLVFEGVMGKIGDRIPLLPALTEAAWLDRSSGAPRLGGGL